MNLPGRFLFSAVALITYSTLDHRVPQVTIPPGPYTVEQAAAGRAAYQANCASCHRPDLSGANEAPQLAGGNFMNAWRNRTTRDLFSYIKGAMPPANPGALDDRTYINIVAYILQANGSVEGSRLLTPATTVAVGSVATGAPPRAPAQAASTPACHLRV